MNEEKYLLQLTKQIHDTEMRNAIQEEYAAHIEDYKEVLIEGGMDELKAEEEAVRQMGDPVAAGRDIDRIYRKTIDWGMVKWFIFLSVVVVLAKLFLPLENGFIFEGIPTVVNNAIGGFLVIYGLVLSWVEKYNDWDLFYSYGRDWNGGYVINSGLILAIGVCFLGRDVQITVFWIVLLFIVQTVERACVTLCRHKKETELLWEIGFADTPITYKGKGTIRNKKMKVATKAEEIPQGAPIMVIGLEGFKPIVVQV